MLTVKLSKAQVSALECRIFDREFAEEAAVLDAMDLGRARLDFPRESAELVMAGIIESSNAELAFAEHGTIRGTGCAKKALGASLALSNLSTKVLRALQG